jgi:CheY-like chemotaxis protein
MTISEQTVFLVVDDFETMRKVITTQLRLIGANHVLTANNGADALQILRNQRVDIVLSDWCMPVMSGLDLLKSIRNDAKLRALPFILMTAESERECVVEAIACGVNGLLAKPYTTPNFRLRVEKALGHKSRPTDQVAIVGAARTPTILIVDDTPFNLRLLTHLFKEDYVVRIATLGEKALEICCSDAPPDLVLLDIMMPGMDGFEVAQRMREHPNAEAIPIIFVTTMASEDARLKGLELGAADFVTKPINPDILKPRVRNFMRYVALRKQLQASYDGMLDAARLREDVEHLVRHDMKGPLAGIIGLVQTLAEDDTLSRSQWTEQLRLVEETALQLLDMVNRSSELFKIETGVVA